MADTQIPVLIVGAGPAGLVTALGLARHGVKSVIVERHPGTSIYPRATAISARSMEIFRAYGLEPAIRAFSLEARPTMSLSATLSDKDHMDVPLGFPSNEQAMAVSPTRPAISPQDHVEPVLVRRLLELGLTDIRFDTELVAIAQSKDGVTASVATTGSSGRSQIRARYLVGADGGRSTVRDLLGIEAVGPTDLEHHAAVLFRADLWSILGERRHGLYGVGGPMGGTVVAPMGPDDRFLLAAQTDPETARGIAADPARGIALVRAAAGVPDLDVEVLASMPLTFVAQVATRWRERNAFLVGDAAHRMPPFGGRGMNTAIADAHNLAWKLAWVVRGLADPALLDSYEAERGPVGRANISLALERYREQQAASGLVLDLAPGTGQQSTPDGLFEDIGYVYRSAAIAENAEVAPGGRAPHVWLDAARSTSTLDAFGEELVLLASGDGGRWRAAIAGTVPTPPLLAALAALGPAIPIEPSLPVKLVVVGRDRPGSDALGVDDGGALLVRPDGHVAAAWRRAPRDHRAALAEAVDVALGRGRRRAVPSGVQPVPRPVTSPEVSSSMS